MRTNLGRVSPLPRGGWMASVAYTEGDIVRAGNAVYIALRQSTGIEPGASAMWTRYWKLFASDGNQADLETLAKTLSLAQTVINMEVSAESVPYGSPISLHTTRDETDKSLSFFFQIPRNADFEESPTEPTFFLNAGSWEVKQVTGLGGADYSVESLGTQDFSNVQYYFTDGMTWEQFVSSAYNVVIGGQFGGVDDTADNGWRETTGKRVFLYDFQGFEGDSGIILMLGDYLDATTDFFERPTSQEIYLDGQVVSPTDLIVAGANYTVGS